MHKNKLKLIIFIQSIVIYCICLYLYFTRSSSSNQNDNNDAASAGNGRQVLLPGQRAASWAQASMQSIDEYRRLAIKHGSSPEQANLYGLGIGIRRQGQQDRLNILMNGFECTKYRIDALTLHLRIWHEFVPNSRVSLLSREQCEFFGSLPQNLVQRILVADGQLELDEILNKETKQNSDLYDLVIDFGQTEDNRHATKFMSIWNKIKSGSLGMYVIEGVHTSYSGKQLVDEFLSILKIQLINTVAAPDANLKDLKLNAESLLSIQCFFNSCLFVKK